MTKPKPVGTIIPELCHLLDGGNLIVIGRCTIHSVYLEELKCLTCGYVTDASDVDNVGPLMSNEAKTESD